MLRTLTIALAVLSPVAMATQGYYAFAPNADNTAINLGTKLINLDRGNEAVYAGYYTTRFFLNLDLSAVKTAAESGTLTAGSTIFTLSAQDPEMFSVSAIYNGEDNPGYNYETTGYVAPITFKLTIRGVTGSQTPGNGQANTAWKNGSTVSFYARGNAKDVWALQERDPSTSIVDDYTCYTSGSMSGTPAAEYVTENVYTITSLTLSNVVVAPTKLYWLGDFDTVPVSMDTTGVTTEGDAPTVSAASTSSGEVVALMTVSGETTISGTTGEAIMSTVNGTSKNFYNVTVSDSLTIGAGNLTADNKVTVSENAKVDLGEGVKLSAKSVNIDKAALHMTHGELESTGTTIQGSIVETSISGTGTIINVSIESSDMSVGNSPGVITLSDDTVSDVTLSAYFGTELATALTSDADAVALVDNLTSGVVVAQGTTLSGTITLNVWNKDNDGTRTWDATAFTGTFTYGDCVQMISLGDGVDVSAVSGATYVIGDDLKSLLGEGLEWKVEVGSDGVSLTVTPEPATATLSLLALVGLCARRRRH